MKGTYTLDQQNYYFAKERVNSKGKMPKRTKIGRHVSNLSSQCRRVERPNQSTNHTSKVVLQSFYFELQIDFKMKLV